MKYRLESAQRAFVEEHYRDDVVYQWLRYPCMKHTADDALMYPEVLYYVCMQVLDLMKRYGSSCDGRVSEQMRTMPYEMREDFFVPNSSHYAEVGCYSACMILTTLSKLLGYSDDELLQEHSQNLRDMSLDFPDVSCWGRNIVVSPYIEVLEKEYSVYSFISAGLDNAKRRKTNICGSDVNICEYISDYLSSGRSISEEIEHCALSGEEGSEELSESLEGARTKIGELEVRVKELERELEERESAMRTMQKEKDVETICVANGKKAKLEAVLVGLYYADYFVNDKGMKLSLEKTVPRIMKDGFNSDCNRLSKDISQFVTTNTLSVFKDDILQMVKDGLDDIKKVQR